MTECLTGQRWGLWYPKYGQFLSLSGLAFSGNSREHVQNVAGLSLVLQLGLEPRLIPSGVPTRPVEQLIKRQGPQTRGPAIMRRCGQIHARQKPH